MEPFVVALVVQGLIGATDVLFNHELIARVPRLPNSAREQRLHSARELVFGTLFGALAWCEWHGMATLVIAALLLAELCISTLDTVLEFDTRLLPVSERIAHVLLFVNFGVLTTLLGQALWRWLALPTALAPVSYGWMSWVLSALSLLALTWSVRDAWSAAQHEQAATA